jgi:hypothetical protein
MWPFRNNEYYRGAYQTLLEGVTTKTAYWYTHFKAEVDSLKAHNLLLQREVRQLHNALRLKNKKLLNRRQNDRHTNTN